MKPLVVRFFLAVVGALTVAMPVPAQHLMVETSAIVTNYYLLKDQLIGGGLELRFARKESPYALHIGGGRYRGGSMRVGVVCAGLVAPGTCTTPEPIHDDARLFVVTAGGSAAFLRREKASLGVLLALHTAYARSGSLGIQSGSTLSGSELMWGGSTGLRGTYSPFRKVPVVIEARSTVGLVNRIFNTDDLDGYNIFRDPVLFTRLTLGISYKLPLKMHDLTPKSPSN